MGRPKLLQETFNLLRYTSFKLWPEATLKSEFKRHAGYHLNLKEPRTFNEKLQWLKINWFDPKATACADKYSVRQFVTERGLEHTLNDLYAVYDDVEQVNLDELPKEFVMKVTHGCGQNLICRDKSELNWQLEKKMFKKWLNKSHYYNSLEWVYKDIKPRIIVEKLIQTSDGKAPKDYKIFCFDGVPKSLFVASDRGDKTTKFDFYDCQWNHLPVKNHYPNSTNPLPKPKELEEMLKYAKVLSKGFPHVRIDFYIEENKVIFGECTFFHFTGSEPFEPKEYDYELGQYLKLPKKLNA